MFIFQEFIEDILEVNKNLAISKNIIDEDTVVFEVKDLENQIIVNTSDYENFELRYVENGFIDSIYKANIFNKNELYDFLINVTPSSVANKCVGNNSLSGEELSSWFYRNKNVKLLGIFVKKGYYFEDTFDEYELHQHNDISFYVQGKKKALITFEERDGMCGSGYTTASFGSAYVYEIENEVDIEKALYLPTKQTTVINKQDGDGGELYLKINKEKVLIVCYDEYGGDSYYPSGYVNSHLPLDSSEIKAKCIVSPDNDDAFVKLELKLNANYQRILPIEPHILPEM